MTRSTTRQLSVVCPCHNEEINVASLVAEVRDALVGLDLVWELILVNDGSTDGTWRRIEEAAASERRVRGINLSRNFGKEAAMLAGLRAAEGDAVAIMDADLQHPPSLLPDLLQAMHEQGVDQVVARRTRAGDPWLRSQLSRLYYRIVRSLIDVPLEDGVGDFRLISRRALNALLQLTETNRFSKGLFAWIGFPGTVVDYANVTRGRGSSSWGLISLVNYGIDGVIAFNNRLLRLGIHLGGATIVISFVYLLWLFGRWLLYGVEAMGYLTTLGAIVLFGGIQLIVLGLMGEYVGRIHTEVKRRPAYLIADEIGPLEIRSDRPAGADTSHLRAEGSEDQQSTSHDPRE